MKKFMLYVGIVLSLSQGLINCSQEEKSILQKEGCMLLNDVKNSVDSIEKEVTEKGVVDQELLNRLNQAKEKLNRVSNLIEKLENNQKS